MGMEEEGMGKEGMGTECPWTQYKEREDLWVELEEVVEEETEEGRIVKDSR